jgi:hypothetical protein
LLNWRKRLNRSEFGNPVLNTAIGSSICILDLELKGESQLYLVRHGVILEPMPLPWPIRGAVVILAAAEVDVDLSQFRVVQGSSLDRILEDLRNTLGAILSEALERLQEKRVKVSLVSTYVVTGAVVGSGIGLPALLVTLSTCSIAGLAVTLCMGGLVAHSLHKDWRRVEQTRFHWAESLREFHSVLAGPGQEPK